MKAVILAAGEGTRMYPLTCTCPKPLLPVSGKPVLRRILEGLKVSGVSEVLVVVGRHMDAVKEVLSGVGLRVEYVVQKRPQGTAHAASLAEEFVGGEDFLLVNGDVLVPEPFYGKILNVFRHSGGNVVSLARVDDVSSYGMVEVKDGRVVRIIEKPEKRVGGLVNAGIYAFTSEFFEELKKTPLSKRGEYELTDTIQRMIDRGAPVIPCEVEGWWVDIGYPWDLLRANELVMENKKEELVIHKSAKVEDGATIHPPVHVGEESTIKAGAYIEGPAYIGRGSVIGPNCYIRPYTSIGNYCHIGNACEIKNSIIMDGTNVAHLSYVGDSIIGENVNLGAGTIIANLRFDGKNVASTVKGRKIDTGRRKMGAIIGGNVKTGIGVMLMPGVMIGSNVMIGPGVVVTENVHQNTMVILKQEIQKLQLKETPSK
ncbi:MAG: NTP transferase domain-containing protein [Candidatus Freyarchaeota archaeon]|nr:NTP transferase domain-containing protein [Candidatus Jordarchaeia archaeon]